jgi:hypothetical protein
MGKAKGRDHYAFSSSEHRMTTNNGVETALTVTCRDCGKKGFPSRKAAKSLSKYLRRGGGGVGLREYQCSSELWHVGHMAPAIRAGRATRADLYDQ